MLGTPIESLVIEDHTYLRYAPSARTNTPSTLHWSISQQDELRAAEQNRAALLNRYEAGTRPEELDALLAPSCCVTGPDSDLHAPVDQQRADELFAYFHAAVASKLCLMARLANEVDIEGPLHHVDIGGGMGNLGAELILDPDCRVQSSLNVEFDAARAVMGRSLLEMHEESLAGRWRFQPEFAQDHAFETPCEFITALGALLYVPRNELIACLDRAWGSLRPGGTFVVYEHIKHPRFERDHHCMFPKDELEEMLHRYGDFSCISGSSLVPIEADTVGDKSVYRVLRKAH